MTSLEAGPTPEFVHWDEHGVEVQGVHKWMSVPRAA